MMLRWKLFLIAIGLLIAGNAHAVNFTLTPKVVGFYSLIFDPLPIPLNNSSAGVYHVNLLMTLDTTTGFANAGDVGFGRVNFDIAFDNAKLQPTVGTTYAGNQKPVDFNAALPGGRVATIATNNDLGAGTADLKGIVASVAGGVFGAGVDPRLMIGQAGGTAYQQSQLTGANVAFDTENGATIVQTTHPPFVIGACYVTYDGTGKAELSFDNVSVGFKNVDGTVNIRTNEQVTLGTVGFGIPEPATLSLAAIAGLGLVRRRRV